MGYSVKKYLYFLLLAVITVYVTHFTSSLVSTAWYVVMLGLYYFSDDEAFWLALFFTTVDGFMGFLGLYSTMLSAIPGMPGVEVAQMYILLSVAKLIQKKNKSGMFYDNWLKILLGYTIFLVVFGLALGLSGPANNYFKVVKMTLPLILFYTIPRLINSADEYARLFSLLFLVFILGFATQIITLVTGFNPAIYSKKAVEGVAELEVGRNFRVLYNEGITLVSISGALYYLGLKNRKQFSDFYLFLVICLTFGMAFLSATRGWILSFGFMITLFFLFVHKITFKFVALLTVMFLIIIGVIFTNDNIATQVEFTIERLTTLESLAEGDLSAGGTLIRLDTRGPEVMAVWEENPVFGAGFSDIFFQNEDFHVGNQNILMHAGIVGYGLFALFLLYLLYKMLSQYNSVNRDNPYRSVFITIAIVIIAWFMLHSSSQQLFAFYGLPLNIFPQAILLTLAGLSVAESNYFSDVGEEEEVEEEELA